MTFRVRRKIFAIVPPPAIVPPSRRASRPGRTSSIATSEAFAPAAYAGRYGWISADLPRLDVDELEALLRQAWRLTAPTKLTRTLSDD